MRPPKPWPGDPAAIWAASAPESAPAPAPASAARSASTEPPDLSRLEDFARRAASPMPGPASAILFAIVGVGAIVYALVIPSIVPEPPEDAQGFYGLFLFALRWHWIAPLMIGVWCLIHAPQIYRKDRRDHPREVRELYDAYRDRGILCETFPTDLKVLGGDGWYDAVIGIDVRTDPARAAQVKRAFRTWFAELASDAKAAQAMRSRNGEHAVRPATDIFGSEAEGGYLIRQSHWHGRWTLLIPDPPNSVERWARLNIVDLPGPARSGCGPCADPQASPARIAAMRSGRTRKPTWLVSIVCTSHGLSGVKAFPSLMKTSCNATGIEVSFVIRM
ncbi:hypothetical protein SAMN05216270_12714 [Glycomyces harbinensis]|uniref:Uncharacterized protein n=1 Tax=Glycomyces harbinensis TaxID=58114 RepID=A0A1G7DPA7_9ACTN|nr:hypothetical protein SAMN05216270_12714 [Glycomyces harbinensis]